MANKAAFFSRKADLELHKLGLGWAITAGAVACTTSAVALPSSSLTGGSTLCLPTPLSSNDFLHGMRSLKLALDEAHRVDDSSLDYSKIVDLIVSDVLLPCAPSPQLASHFIAIATQMLTPHVLTLRYPVHSPVTRHRENSESAVLTPYEVACLHGDALLCGTSRGPGSADGETAALITTYSVVPLPLNLRMPIMLDFLGTLDGMEEVLMQKPPPGSLTETNSQAAADGGTGFAPAWQNTAWESHMSRSCTLLLHRLPLMLMGEAEQPIPVTAVARVSAVNATEPGGGEARASDPASSRVSLAAGGSTATTATALHYDVAQALDEQFADEVSTQQLRGVLTQLASRIHNICASTCLSLKMLSRHSMAATSTPGSSSKISLANTGRADLGSRDPTQVPKQGQDSVLLSSSSSSAQSGTRAGLPKLPAHLQQQHTPLLNVSLDVLLLDFWTQEGRLLHDVAVRAARDVWHIAAAVASPELRADGACTASTAAAALLMYVIPASWVLPSPGVSYTSDRRDDSGPSSTSIPLWAWCSDMEARAAVLLSASGLKPKDVQALVCSAAAQHHPSSGGPKKRPEGRVDWQHQPAVDTSLSVLCLMPPAGHPWPLPRLTVPTALLTVLLRAFAAESNASPAYVVCRASLPPPLTAQSQSTRHVSLGMVPTASSQSLAATPLHRLRLQSSSPPIVQGGSGHTSVSMYGMTAVTTSLIAAAATRTGFLVSGLWLRDVDLPGMLPSQAGPPLQPLLPSGAATSANEAVREASLLCQAPMLLISAGLMEGFQRRAMRVLRSGSPGMGAVRAGGGLPGAAGSSTGIRPMSTPAGQSTWWGGPTTVAGGSGGGAGVSDMGGISFSVGNVASAPIAHDAASALLGEVVLAVQWDSRATSAAAAAQGLSVGNWATLAALPMMVTADPKAIGGDDTGHAMRLARGWAMGVGPRPGK